MELTWLVYGIALTFFFTYFVHRFKISETYEAKSESSKITTILCFFIAVLLLPVLILFLSVIILYRCIAYLHLSIKCKDTFRGLLKGPDVMWAMETEEARSIINVLLLLEIPSSKIKCTQTALSTGKELLQAVQSITDRSLINPLSPFPKLKWLRRKSKLGYYYWEICKELTADHFVRPMKMCGENPDGLSKKELECLLGKYSNMPLPFNDTGTWEMLVGQNYFLDVDGGTTTKCFPILVRIHHSVGDGVALLRLFLEALADRGDYRSSANLKQKKWAKSRLMSLSTESAEYDSSSDENDNGVGIQPPLSHTALAPCDLSSPSVQIKTFEGTIDPKVKVGSKIKTAFANIKKKPSLKNTFSSPTRIKSFYVKKQCSSYINKVCSFQRLKSLRCPPPTEIKTCIVPPRPRSVSPYPSTSTRKILEENNANQLQRSQRSSSFSNIVAETNTIVKKEKICSVKFEKCTPLKKKFEEPLVIADIKNGNLLLEAFQWKFVFLYTIIGVILSVVCIKRTLQLYFNYLFPKLLKILKFCFLTPHVMYCQLLKPTDNDILYGEKILSGNKNLSWVVEGNELKNGLQSQIKLVRNRCGSSTKFTHVMFACLSKSLHRYYLKRGAHVPSYINVVLPARVNMGDLRANCQTTAQCQVGSMKTKVTRMYNTRKVYKKKFQPVNLSFSNSTGSETEVTTRKLEDIHRALRQTSIKGGIELDNKFTVAMIKLPVGSVPLNQDVRLLEEIQKECHRLRSAPDYLANYWLLRWFAHWVPHRLLKPFLKGAPCTLVLSNLPGPEDIVRLAHNPVRDIIFWVPNRGLNGIGVGMLSYCGRFSTGIITDQSLMIQADDAQRIIKGIYEEAEDFLKEKD